MSKTDPTSSTPHRWPASTVNPNKPKPVPLPIFDPTRRPPLPPSGRRGLLSGAAAAVLGGAVASCVPPETAQSLPDQFPAHGGRAAATSPDAELLALCAEYVALDRASLANNRAGADMLATDPAWKALYAKGCAMVPRLHELENLIADTTPRTRAGLLAKAEVARRSLVSDGDDPEEADLMQEESHLACTVIENLLDMIGGQA